MTDQAVSAELSRIRSLMEESQRFLCGTWRHQLLWGVLTSVGLLATWWSLTGPLGAVRWATWPVLLAIGWVASFALARRDARRGPVSNVATRAFGGIWVGLGITLTLLGTAGVYTGAIDPRSLPGLMSVVFGTGYFASGFLAGIRWLTVVAVGWWLGGLLLFVWNGPAALLIMCGMVVALEVLPALALRAQEHGLVPEA